MDDELKKMRNKYGNINKDDIPKINYFLINLIANQSLFKIKNYLLKRNSLNSGFIFPIDQICVTSSFLLNSLKNAIKEEKKRNNEIEKLISIIINVLKIVQSRNRAYNGKLFGGEKEIMIEQESNFNSMIFDAESLLFIYKIQKIYNDLNNESNNIINKEKNKKEIGKAFYNIFTLENIDDNNLGDNAKGKLETNLVKNEDDNNLEDNSKGKYENNLQNLHIKYLDLFNQEKIKNLFNPKTNYPITLNALLYYMKFVIFNYYFYLVYPKILNNLDNYNVNDLNKNEYFKKIIPEFKNYYEISKALYILDDNLNEEPNINLYNLIKFLQYISNENLIMNKEINKIIPLNKIIYEVIDTLREKKCFNEALSIGNSLFPFLSNFDEYNSYLRSVLELKDYPLAYSFLNNCLLLYYQNIDQDQEDSIKNFIHSDVYFEIRQLYIIFYEYLITNHAIDVIFKIPLNFIEIYIFKEFCKEKEQYKEFLIIYYIIIGNISEAKYYFQKYVNLNHDKESPSKILYSNLINYYETLMNKKFKNDNVDEMIEKFKKDNKFLLKIDDNEERINNNDNGESANIRNDLGFSESLMKSSIMENKIVTGSKINLDDYGNLSTDLMTKISNSFNKNLSSNYLSKENKKKLIKMKEIRPFSNTSQLNSVKSKYSIPNINNLFPNK